MKMKSVLRIPCEEIAKWNDLLNRKRIDYDKEKIGENRCLFVKTVRFDDGMLGDIKVCSTVDGGELYSEMVVYTDSGHDKWLSEAKDHLSGKWEIGGYDEGEEVIYEIDVIPIDADPFKLLGISSDDFVEMLKHELENGISSEYSKRIAESTALLVAKDIAESADVKEWNTCDVSLAAGRSILKAIGCCM